MCTAPGTITYYINDFISRIELYSLIIIYSRVIYNIMPAITITTPVKYIAINYFNKVVLS